MGREARARTAKDSQRRLLNQQIPQTGLPGEPGHLVLHNEFVAGDPRNAIPVGGGIGGYRVILTLARPGFLPVPETEFSFDPDIPGDSHLAIAAPAVKLVARPDDPIVAMTMYSESSAGRIEFVGRPNKKGFLGRVEGELQANNLLDAERRAYRTLAPALSDWSAQLDIPLRIWRIHVTAVETGATQISVINPFVEATVLSPTGILSPEYRGFSSLYREALESNSPAYQFLCLFKLIEGIRYRRGRLAKEAKSSGSDFTRPIESVPEHADEFEPWLNALYPTRRQWDEIALDSIFVREARGRRFGDVIGHELRDLRNAVAHALSDSTGAMTVSADEALHLDRVSQWIPLTKCIVRRMLKNEFPEQYLAYLREDGTLIDTSATERP